MSPTPAQLRPVSSVRLALLIAVAALSSPAHALQFSADPSQSKVEFLAIGRPSALKIVGKGDGASGSLSESGGKATGSIRFELDQLETGISMRDRHMKEKYLETGKFPAATLKIEGFELPKEAASEKFAAQGVPFTGTLSLHGVERPVAGTADLSRDGETAGALARFKIKLTDYGVDIPKFAGVTVAEDVDVTVNLQGKVSQTGAKK